MLTTSFSDVSGINGKGLAKAALWNLIRVFTLGAMGPREDKEKAERERSFMLHNTYA